MADDLGPVELEFVTDAADAAAEVRELADEAKALAGDALEAKAGLDEMRDGAAETAAAMSDFRDQAFEAGEALDEVRDHAAEAAEADQALADSAFEAAEALGHLRDEALEAKESLNGVRDAELEAGAAGAGDGAGGISVMAFAIVALVAAAAAVLPAFTAAGAGIGAFALFAYPAIEQVVKGLGDTKKKLAELPAPVREMVGDVRSLEDEWKRMSLAFRPEAFALMDQALGIVRRLLPELIPLAKAGGEALGGMMHALSGGLNSAGFRDFLHLLTSMVGPATMAITHLAGAIFGLLGNAIRTLAPISVPFVSMLTSLLRAAGPALANALKFIAEVLMQIGHAITPLLGPLGRMFGWLANNPVAVQFATALIGVAAAIKVVSVAMAIFNAVMDADPIVLIIAAIGLLVFAFIELWNRSAAFRDFWIGIWRSIQGAAMTAWHGIDTAFHLIEAGVDIAVSWIKSHWELLPSIFLGPFGIVLSIVLTHLHTIEGWFSDAWNHIKGIVIPVMTLIVSVIRVGLTLAEGIVRGVFEQIAGVFESSWDLIKGIVTTATDFVVGVIRTAWDLAVGLFEVFGDLIEGHWHAAWTTLLATGRQFITNIIGVIRGGVSGFATLLFNAGRALVMGLVHGIESMFGAVGGAISHLAGLIPAGLGSILKILSPSRVTYAQGINIALGWVHGILDSAPQVAAAVAHVAGLIGVHPAIGAAAGIAAAAAAIGGGGRSAAAPVTVNVPISVQGSMTPQALHELQEVVQEAVLRYMLNNQGTGMLLPGKIS